MHTTDAPCVPVTPSCVPDRTLKRTQRRMSATQPRRRRGYHEKSNAAGSSDGVSSHSRLKSIDSCTAVLLPAAPRALFLVPYPLRSAAAAAHAPACKPMQRVRIAPREQTSRGRCVPVLHRLAALVHFKYHARAAISNLHKTKHGVIRASRSASAASTACTLTRFLRGRRRRRRR